MKFWRYAQHSTVTNSLYCEGHGETSLAAPLNLKMHSHNNGIAFQRFRTIRMACQTRAVYFRAITFKQSNQGRQNIENQIASKRHQTFSSFILTIVSQMTVLEALRHTAASTEPPFRQTSRVHNHSPRCCRSENPARRTEEAAL